MTPLRIRIFYPADPMGVVPGGIDTFIRGLIKWAPPDLAFSLVGMTTDPVARPVGRFTRCMLGQRGFDFFAAVHVARPGQRGRVPLSARYTLAVARSRALLARDFDVFDFHRIEPMLPFLRDRRPKNAFFHHDPDPRLLRSAQTDILWKRLPTAYDAIEARLVPRLASAWCVREAGVATLQARYPEQAAAFRFVPTWVDASVFSPVSEAKRLTLRRRLGRRLALDPDALRIVTVGRLDTSKDPRLMLDAFAELVSRGRRLALLIVGDGVLRRALEQRVSELGLTGQVRFLGLCSATEIANVLRGCDLYALTSAYESMPMALLEALGCGLPAATTDVGEVRRVVTPGVNGAIARDRSPLSFADCVAEVLDRLGACSGAPAVAATDAFQPERVLAPVYENYRALARRARSAGHDGSTLTVPATSAPTAAAAAASTLPATLPSAAYAGRVRQRVVGVPIDVVGAQRAREIVLDWAARRESRCVCFCNVHSCTTYSGDPRHADAVDAADLALADGAPIAWTLRRKGHAGQPRIDGPGTMWALCRDAEAHGVKVGLYGSTPGTVRTLRKALRLAFPELHVSYCEAPPFGPMTAEKDEAVSRGIDNAGVGLLFVALGCPKQESWMAEHRGRIHAVMLGVGAAFDFHAGLVRRAPPWMQDAGLEWLHRMAAEPGRLWQRYLVSNGVFIIRNATDLAGTGVRRAAHYPVRLSLRIVAPRRGPSRDGSAPARGNTTLNQEHIAELLARVDTALARESGRVVGFIASGDGEGTSTIAAAYAHTSASRPDRRVLLLGAQADPLGGRPGLLEALAAGQPATAAVALHAGGYWSGALFGTAADEAAWSLAGRNELWKAVRGAFDEIVLDMPSSAASRTGVMMAQHCDGVIVVLEAAKTRAPVVEALVHNLQAVRANLLGTVLNKREFYVPDAVYRRL